MWDHWNKALHNSEMYCNNILDSQVNEQVRALYSQGLQAIPWDAFEMFQALLETLLLKPKSYKEQ